MNLKNLTRLFAVGSGLTFAKWVKEMNETTRKLMNGEMDLPEEYREEAAEMLGLPEGTDINEMRDDYKKFVNKYGINKSAFTKKMKAMDATERALSLSKMEKDYAKFAKKYGIDNSCITEEEDRAVTEQIMDDAVNKLEALGYKKRDADVAVTKVIIQSMDNNEDMTDVETIVEKALKDVNAKDSTGCTALIKAVEGGHADVIKQLIKHGADVNAKDGRGCSALINALEIGVTDIVELLIEHGADVNGKSGLIIKSSPLEVALKKGHTEIAQILIKNRADTNIKIRGVFHTYTPKEFCIKKGYKEIADLLALKTVDDVVKSDS